MAARSNIYMMLNNFNGTAGLKINLRNRTATFGNLITMMKLIKAENIISNGVVIGDETMYNFKIRTSHGVTRINLGHDIHYETLISSIVSPVDDLLITIEHNYNSDSFFPDEAQIGFIDSRVFEDAQTVINQLKQIRDASISNEAHLIQMIGRRFRSRYASLSFSATLTSLGRSTLLQQRNWLLNDEIRHQVMTDEEFDKLDTFDFDPEQHDSCDICTVCQEEFEAGEQMTKLNCDHFFHRDCIKRWLTTGNCLCPNCRNQENGTGINSENVQYSIPFD